MKEKYKKKRKNLTLNLSNPNSRPPPGFDFLSPKPVAPLPFTDTNQPAAPPWIWFLLPSAGGPYTVPSPSHQHKTSRSSLPNYSSPSLFPSPAEIRETKPANPSPFRELPCPTPFSFTTAASHFPLSAAHRPPSPSTVTARTTARSQPYPLPPRPDLLFLVSVLLLLFHFPCRLASTETNRCSPSSNRTRRPAAALLQQHAHRAVSVHPHLGVVSHQNRPEETDIKRSKIYCCVHFCCCRSRWPSPPAWKGRRDEAASDPPAA